MKAKKTAKRPPSWWRFTGDEETFVARNPHRISRLYFPLCNEAGLLSSIAPDLQGDIKTGQNSFLTLPVSGEDLHNTRSGRNFWVMVENRQPWSAAGASAQAHGARLLAGGDTSQVEAGLLWHKVTRENKHIGLRSEILNFVPAGKETVEIMWVKLTNISRRPRRITPTAAIPLFGRSADNLRDHRHVTSLLHRITVAPQGVLVQPTMSFDERGHQMNQLVYAVLGCEESGEPPVGCFPTVPSFIGEGGSFDAPQAVLDDLDAPDLSEAQRQGREAMGALRFRARKLAAGKSASYIVLMGVAKDRKEAEAWVRAYGSESKVAEALEETRIAWRKRVSPIRIQTGDKDWDAWLKWVTVQPVLRKIFGNSFLPEFDYGRGGRGWRDLWQDGLALLLLQPGAARSLLLNNFGGVRMNGTNATIIGKQPGEFIADRNNISRVWMDHGVWPWLTTELYIHQTGDVELLLAEAPYFWDQDKALSPAAERGTILEHLLVQHLTAYFNVGDHGNCRLLDADWNDGLDMAHDKGESVPFTAVYAGNLLRLSAVLEKLAEQRRLTSLPLAEEIDELLEKSGDSTRQSPEQKRSRLENYRAATRQGVSGRKRELPVQTLIHDLAAKGRALSEQVRKQEWLSAGWFNGYYDNAGRRVEGAFDGDVRMTLTGQVFPILSGVASDEQTEKCFASVKKYLQDKKFGGFRLNTDFGDHPPPLGRAFYFAYGEKENGAFFSHMVVMCASALYQRGFAEEGFEVLSSLFRMCMNTDVSRIYPGIPEYFNGEGRGMYHYLTGSASWYLLTLVTQVLGIRGEWGDLRLAPKLMPEQFSSTGQLIAQVEFAGKSLRLTYLNRGKKPFGKYVIESVLIHGHSLPLAKNSTEILIPRSTLTDLPGQTIDLTVALT